MSTPVAGGEYVWGIVPFRHMVEARSVDVVMIDLVRVGGITQWMKVAGMAEAFNLPVVSHLIPEVHVHLIGAVPNGLTVEYMPWLMPLFEEVPQQQNGELVMPTAPGLGLKFDQSHDRPLPRRLIKRANAGGWHVDLVVANGLEVLPSGAEPADIGVASGKIGAPGSLAAIGAGRTLDASGQIVIPGGIDPNVHCRWPIVVPGTTQHQMTDGPARGLARRYDDELDSAFSDVNGPDVLKLRLSLEHEPMMGCWSYGTQPVLVGEVEKYMGPQTHTFR